MATIPPTDCPHCGARYYWTNHDAPRECRKCHHSANRPKADCACPRCRPGHAQAELSTLPQEGAQVPQGPTATQPQLFGPGARSVARQVEAFLDYETYNARPGKPKPEDPDQLSLFTTEELDP